MNRRREFVIVSRIIGVNFLPKDFAGIDVASGDQVNDVGQPFSRCPDERDCLRAFQNGRGARVRLARRNCSGFVGAGVGIGVVFGALILGVARNPSLRGQLFSYAILGFAFAEATGLN